MNQTLSRHCIAFDGHRRIAVGRFPEVVAGIKQVLDSGHHRAILFFDAHTSELLEADTRGSLEEVMRRYADDALEPAPELPVTAAPEPPRGRGRPKLGVVAREVTLLPRHWEWLGEQPGGASVALRKLVEQARKAHAGRDAARRAREATYRFLSAIGSGQDSFEEAARALFAQDRSRFESLLADWPPDVRAHALTLAADSFAAD